MFNEEEKSSPPFIAVFFNTLIAGFFILAFALLISGCGGSGSSSGASNAGPSSVKVRGNVSSFNDGLAILSKNSDKISIARAINKMSLLVVPDAQAAVRVVADIEVCILDFCTVTDSAGSFELDLAGAPAGTYTIRFSADGVSYTSEIEVMEDALVILENVSIAEDGVVRVNNIKIVLLEDDDSGDEDSAVDNDSDDQDSADDNSEIAAVEKIEICHRPGTPAEKTLNLPESALKGHLGHGDTEGACI